MIRDNKLSYTHIYCICKYGSDLNGCKSRIFSGKTIYVWCNYTMRKVEYERPTACLRTATTMVINIHMCIRRVNQIINTIECGVMCDIFDPHSKLQTTGAETAI